MVISSGIYYSESRNVSKTGIVYYIVYDELEVYLSLIVTYITTIILYF